MDNTVLAQTPCSSRQVQALQRPGEEEENVEEEEKEEDSAVAKRQEATRPEGPTNHQVDGISL